MKGVVATAVAVGVLFAVAFGMMIFALTPISATKKPGAGNAAALDVSGVASTGTWQTPIVGASPTSGFGPRVNPVTGVSTTHTGQDWGCPQGDKQPLLAVSDGKVVFMGHPGQFPGRTGAVVVIYHGDNTFSLYNHLYDGSTGYPGSTNHARTIKVTMGQTVTRGQPVANCGFTGVGTGIHLHLEILKGNPNQPLRATAINPIDFLTKAGVPRKDLGLG